MQEGDVFHIVWLVQRIAYRAKECVVEQVDCIVFVNRAVGIEVAGLVEGILRFAEEDAVKQVDRVVFVDGVIIVDVALQDESFSSLSFAVCAAVYHHLSYHIVSPIASYASLR